MTSPPRKQRESGVFKEVWRITNALTDYVREISPMPSLSRGVSVDRKSNGTGFRVEVPEVEGGTGRVVSFRVHSIYGDYIVGTNLETGELTNLAKPFNLRRTPWDGETLIYNLEPYPSSPGTLTVEYVYVTDVYRKAIIGSYVEHQVIRPIWQLAFSEVAAALCDSTGVAGCDWLLLDPVRAWTMVYA